MKLTKQGAQLYAPGGQDALASLAKTDELCIAAHQDDVEIMAYAPIARCYKNSKRRFSAAVVSDGAGSPRTGLYEACSDEEMKAVRVQEQKQAAAVGDYEALALLGFGSAEIKDAGNQAVVEDIRQLIMQAAPKTVYTHNPADKHDTHVAVCLRVIQALRQLPKEARPEKLYGMEVWRGLDWLCDADKTAFDTSARPNLAAALLGVFDSQISGGKRYDLAALARRTANATFFESHETDDYSELTFGLDMSVLLQEDSVDPAAFIAGYIANFAGEVEKRLERLWTK